MGNNQSRDESLVGSEMSSAKKFSSRSCDTEPPPCDIEELWRECQALQGGSQLLAQAIDEIFLEDDVVEESASEMEERLHKMIQDNQDIVRKLTRNLERHANLVDQGQEQNERLMALVKHLVSVVNNYMTMLIRNIRRLKRLISEMKPPEDGSSMYQLQQQQQRQGAKLIYDVISDHQDVDAMLKQLLETEKQREELEKDIITVLVYWMDYRYLHLLAEDEENDVEEIEKDVQKAADSVAHGLAQLNAKT